MVGQREWLRATAFSTFCRGCASLVRAAGTCGF